MEEKTAYWIFIQLKKLAYYFLRKKIWKSFCSDGQRSLGVQARAIINRIMECVG